MVQFVNVENPRSRFVLDLRVNGKLRGDPKLVLEHCPECGGEWSSICPLCDQVLAVKLIHGRVHASCCDERLHPKAKAA